MVFDYLEMKSRTDVSNTRLDMLRELLNVLQQQMEVRVYSYVYKIYIYISVFVYTIHNIHDICYIHNIYDIILLIDVL